MKFNTKKDKEHGGVALLSRISAATQNNLTTAKSVLIGFLYSAMSFLLGTCLLPFGAEPIGIAFLSAANKKIPYIFAGLCLSSLFSDEPVITLAAYLVTLLVRMLVRLTLDPPWDGRCESGEIDIFEIAPELFNENVYLRMATSCVGVFCVGLYSLIKGGFLYYDLIGAVLAMVISPLFVAAVYGLFSKRIVPKAYEYLSVATIGFFLVFSSREISLYGLSISALGGLLATFYVCRKKGIVLGMCAGAVLGLAYSPILSPAFFLLALAYGALIKVSSVFGCTAAFGIALAYSIYVRGISALTSFMPALLAACLLFAVLEKTFLQKRSDKAEDNEAKAQDDAAVELTENAFIAKNELTSTRLFSTIERQKNICDTFLSMSEFFSELGEKMKTPIIYDTKNICDSAFDASCASCKCAGVCWEEKHDETIAAINTLSARLHRSGKLSAEDVPESLRTVCARMPDIIDGINHNYTLHTRRLVLCDKTEIFATDYKAMHDLLATSIELDATEFCADLELSAKLCALLEANELGVRSIISFGNRRKKILISGNSKERLKKSEAELLKTLEDALERPLTVERLDDDSEGQTVMIITEKKAISVEYVTRSTPSAFEKEFCGDTTSVFENADATLYSVISDGMGSGRDAALSSGICVMFLKKMLSSSLSTGSTLKLLNAFLRNKGSGSVHECSATLDLLELDMISKKASFYKSGAAPSFVFRGGNLFKLRSNTLPLGIIRELDAKRLSFDIKDGDVIIMVSDGVTAGRDECPWLLELLKKNLPIRSLDTCADLIIEKAKSLNGSDDVSVTLIKISDN